MPLSASTQSPFRAAELAFAIIGLSGLALISLSEPASSLIHSTPWKYVYAITLLTPMMGFCARVASDESWTPPTRIWSIFLGALLATVLISAMLSPYTKIVWWWSAPVLAGIALFLWLHARINSLTGFRDIVATGMAIGSALLVLRSMVAWTQDAHDLLHQGAGFATLMDIRNAHPLGHSNYTAGAVLLGLPWLVRAAVQSRGLRRAGWSIITLLGLAALFTSGSRGGILGLGVLAGLGLLLLRLPRRRLIWSGAILIVLGAAFALTNPRVRSTLKSADPAAAPNLSSVQRRAMIHAGWQLGRARPVFGWGLHATPLVYPRVRAQLDGGAENVLQLHSTPIELWAGLGALGMGSVTMLLGLAGFAWRREPTAAVALVGYGVFALTDHQLDLPIVVAAIAASGAMLAPSAIKSWGKRPRWAAGATCFSIGLAVGIGGERDPTPAMNTTALQIATDPARSSEAIALLQSSLAANPDQELAHFNLGWLLVVANPAQAEWHFRQAALLVPDKGGVYFGLGLARLNQGQTVTAAHCFAVECVNDPRFMTSQWWNLEAMESQRHATKQQFRLLLKIIGYELPEGATWRLEHLNHLIAAVDQIGRVNAEDQRSYRRERTGYPVLMRNLDIPPPIDLYDVRESQPQAGEEATTLPPKGWLPGPLLLKLLDPAGIAIH
ncbi:O-antigen ligase family protein [Synoicihabitans lomoniglobus]|uniref:O-antigen ligase family protein n=1 Tax=Synoicihabitans lomoniglobus TaxID=2909285 RepID=A0AAF0I3W4_9BACT|nr:O-antigen ligase family protein [Opitutaceae bacterium LMO-M01]WED67272.1 O-antigen ligase family protein [Opitutaceae bacterium LMO-M01]